MVALQLRKRLEEQKLEALAKTSGSKGLQVYVPLNGRATYEKTKAFALAMATTLEKDLPDLVVSRMSKELRKGKVFVDWSQNDEHKTTVAVYSLRAKAAPTVSTPVSWREVTAASKGGKSLKLRFLTDETLARVKKQGDLFSPALKMKQSLPR